MKLELSLQLNLKTEEVTARISEALKLGLRDFIVVVTEDAVDHSPWKTGNNRRSIFYGVTGFQHQQALIEGRQPGDTWTGEDISLLDESKIEGVIYSTSGYGGYLETGTTKMAAQPYIAPAYFRHVDEIVPMIKEHLE